MSNNSSHIAIVGAGPAGLMAAEHLARNGFTVTVFDGKPTPARKFLLAGRGGLNLTHAQPLPEFLKNYHDAEPQLTPIINAFPPADLIAWVHGLGVQTFVGSSGRVFPKSLKTSPLLRAWLARLQNLGVTFQMSHDWIGWHDARSTPNPGAGIPPGLQFKQRDGAIKTVTPDAVLLALGGASWPRLGADGRWVPLLDQKGVTIAPLKPFNAGVKIHWSQTLREKFEGAPLKRLTITCNTTSVPGEAIITKTGLEGGAIYALNTAILQALETQPTARLTVDLRPDLTHQQLTTRLSVPRASQSMATFLRKTARLSKPAIALSREPGCGALPTMPEDLARLLKAVPLEVSGLCGLDRAISTSGGVALSECDTAGMLKNCPGVFIAGEMLNWDAPTGGYLLQATFATAVQSANGITRWLTEGESTSENRM